MTDEYIVDDKGIVDQTAELGALFEALAAAQGEMEPAKKDSKNPHFNSKYADLASAWSAARSPLSKNKLAVVQTTRGGSDGSITIISTLGHASGQWMRGEITLRATKPDAQGIGSALTYARRFGFCGIVGIAPDDDDGNAASAKPEAKKQAPTPTQPPKQSENNQLGPTTPSQPLRNATRGPQFSVVDHDGVVSPVPTWGGYLEKLGALLTDAPNDSMACGFVETNYPQFEGHLKACEAEVKRDPSAAEALKAFRMTDALLKPYLVPPPA